MESIKKLLFGDEQTQSAGRELALQLLNDNQLAGCVITLSGELGAGKSTFCRGFIAACGYTGAVKSPTYTLIETYSTDVTEIRHLDLYRLDDPEELEFIGFRDLLASEGVLLIEWPERVPAIAALATAEVSIDHRDAESRLLKIHFKHKA